MNNIKSEISIKLHKNGNITTVFNSDLEDLRQMTNALIAHSDKTEAKMFILALSTIVDGYKSIVLDKKQNN